MIRLISSLYFLGLGTASAVTLFQTETFDSGVAGFREGASSPNAPVNIGGELSNTASGSGAGGRLLMWTDSAEWTGSFVGATAVTLDARAETNSINLRLAINGPGGWFVTNDQILAADGSFSTLSFSLDEANFTRITTNGTTGIFRDTFDVVTRFEILSSVSDTPSLAPANGTFLRGDNIAATLVIDNLTAVPEPSSTMLLGLALCGFLRRKR